MNEIKKGIVLISLIVLALPLLLQACQSASESSFEVLSLDVTPIKVLVNDKFSVSADISNAGKSEATYTVQVKVNGIVDDRTSVMLSPGKSQKVQFTLLRSQPGTYEIKIGNKTSLVTVEKATPASFKITDFTINVEQVNPGEEVVVVARVANTGGSEGTYIAELKVNDMSCQSDRIIILPGSAYKFTFKLTENEPGIYDVAMGDATKKFTVLEPIKLIEMTAPVSAEAPYQRKSLRPQAQSCCPGRGSCN